MTEQLAQILSRAPTRSSDLAVLQQVFKQVSGLPLTGVIRSINQNLLLQLPLLQSARGQVQYAQIPVNQASLQSQLSETGSIVLKLVPQLSGNRLALQIQESLVQTGDSSHAKPMSKDSALAQQLQQWSRSLLPLALIQLKKTGNPDDVKRLAQLLVSTAKTAANEIQTPVRAGKDPTQAALDKSGLQSTPPSASTSALKNALSQQLTIDSKSHADSKSRLDSKSSTDAKSIISPSPNSKTASNRHQISSRLQSVMSSENQSSTTPMSLAKLLRSPELLSRITSDYQQQSSLQKVFRQLMATMSNNEGAKIPASSKAEADISTQRLVELFTQTFVDGKNLSKDQLKQLLLKSGLFHENQLRSLLLNQKLGQLDPKQSTAASLTPASQLSPPQLSNPATSLFPIDWKLILFGVKHILAQQSQLLQSTQSQTGVSQIVGRWMSQFQSTHRLSKSLNEQKKHTEILQRLVQQVDAGISRIKVLQHQSLISDPSQPMWLFELPLSHQDSINALQLKLEQQTLDKNETKKRWLITIRFKFETLGAFLAKTELVDRQLDIRFIAERPSTRQLLQEHVDDLENSLVDAGILMKKSAVESGKAPTLIPDNLHDQLVDVKI